MQYHEDIQDIHVVRAHGAPLEMHLCWRQCVIPLPTNVESMLHERYALSHCSVKNNASHLKLKAKCIYILKAP